MPVLVRLQPDRLATLDAWIARQRDEMSRPEAIRRLIEAALEASKPSRKKPKARA